MEICLHRMLSWYHYVGMSFCNIATSQQSGNKASTTYFFSFLTTVLFSSSHLHCGIFCQGIWNWNSYITWGSWGRLPNYKFLLQFKNFFSHKTGSGLRFLVEGEVWQYGHAGYISDYQFFFRIQFSLATKYSSRKKNNGNTTLLIMPDDRAKVTNSCQLFWSWYSKGHRKIGYAIVCTFGWVSNWAMVQVNHW